MLIKLTGDAFDSVKQCNMEADHTDSALTNAAWHHIMEPSDQQSQGDIHANTTVRQFLHIITDEHNFMTSKLQ